jgi:TPR repeat protein
VKRDLATAEKNLRLSYKAGSCPSAKAYAVLLGLAPEAEVPRVERFTKAADLFRASADNEDGFGLGWLGFCHLYGLGVARPDAGVAFELFFRAAMLGDSYWEVQLGNLFFEGIGVGKDVGNAYSWYAKAADAGNPLGKANVGMMYALGHGVPVTLAGAGRAFRACADPEKAADQVCAANLKRVVAAQARRSRREKKEQGAETQAEEEEEGLQQSIAGKKVHAPMHAWEVPHYDTLRLFTYLLAPYWPDDGDAPSLCIVPEAERSSPDDAAALEVNLSSSVVGSPTFQDQ